MIRVSSILFWFGLTIVTSLALYGTSNKVQDLTKQLRIVNTQIEAEQANIHVLKAEWVYLSNPARIEAAARKYLDMHPTAVSRIAKLKNLPDLMPTKEEAMAGVDVKGQPLATVSSALPVQPSSLAAPTRHASARDSAHLNTHIVIQKTEKPVSTPETAEDGPDSLRLADNNLRAADGTEP